MIERLQRRIAELEGQTKPGDPLRMPGLKAKSARKPPAQQQPRKQRRHGFARPRMTPTHRVEHVMENCPDCGAHRSGGWTQRTREVIELPVVPVQVTEHVYIARTCPACRRRCTPPAVLDGVVLGQQRLGVNLLSLIATLREEGRLPIRSVQWYLDTVHQLRLSVGAIVSAIHQTAQRAQPAVAAILDRIRASPVVHADETGWREDGANGYVWTFSTPTERYFLRRGRGKAVVDEALGESFSGVLVSDFYAAYHHYDGPKQRCLAHLLRDIHNQRTRYPKDAALARWAAAVHQLYVAAKACNHHEPWQRRVAQLAWERKLLAICRPFLSDPSAVPSDGGALGTRWVYLRMASSAKSPWKVFEMLHHYRSVGDKYRPIDLFVVCSDSTAEHVLWEEGKGLRLITTTLAEAMSGQLVGPNTVWRRFGESVSIYPRIVPTDHPER